MEELCCRRRRDSKVPLRNSFEKLLQAVLEEDLDFIRAYKGDINQVGSWSSRPLPCPYSALCCAIATQKFKATAALLQSGADPAVKPLDPRQEDAALIAQGQGRFYLAQTLRNHVISSVKGTLPLKGKWVPEKGYCWHQPAFGKDPRTVHVWDEKNYCVWSTAQWSGTSQVLSVKGNVYNVFYLGDQFNNAMFGTITMDGPDSYTLRLPDTLMGERGGGVEIMKRAK
mmetsp:Transcript_110456/g.235982  ORF Transcript_110456/g.235982 Transcript_110456/m.235982 type:complete len:227 (+) Transcript_110456:69-749(+)